MSVTFTPGPWELRGPRGVYGNLHQNNTGDLVCTAFSDANARLIAAAPEIYATLGDLANECINDIRAKPETLQRAVDVMRKARGESS